MITNNVRKKKYQNDNYIMINYFFDWSINNILETIIGQLNSITINTILYVCTWLTLLYIALKI